MFLLIHFVSLEPVFYLSYMFLYVVVFKYPLVQMCKECDQSSSGKTGRIVVNRKREKAPCGAFSAVTICYVIYFIRFFENNPRKKPFLPDVLYLIFRLIHLYDGVKAVSCTVGGSAILHIFIGDGRSRQSVLFDNPVEIRGGNFIFLKRCGLS